MGIESDIKKILQDVIDEEDGNQSKAARRLGVGRFDPLPNTCKQVATGGGFFLRKNVSER